MSTARNRNSGTFILPTNGMSKSVLPIPSATSTTRTPLSVNMSFEMHDTMTISLYIPHMNIPDVAVTMCSNAATRTTIFPSYTNGLTHSFLMLTHSTDPNGRRNSSNLIFLPSLIRASSASFLANSARFFRSIAARCSPRILFSTALLRVRPETLSGVAEFSQHETDGSELEESERCAVEVVPVLGQSPAAVEPCGRLEKPPHSGRFVIHWSR